MSQTIKKPLFVVLHGSGGSPEENWFPALKQRLERLGQEVVVPRFPVGKGNRVTEHGRTEQSLQSWLEAARDLVKQAKGRQLVLVAHSLGPLFALHLIDRFDFNVDCLIAVSPFFQLDSQRIPEQISRVNQTFYRQDFDFDKIKRHVKAVYVLYSENDPYVPKATSLVFAAKLGASAIMVRGAGHMNADINMNEFPLVLELCKSRVDLTLYQKYLDHRAELFTEDTAKYHTQEIINVSAADMFDEGVFKFRNLRKYGFCTLPTDSLFWNNQSVYMQEARRAARRLGTLTRVFLVDKLSDLQRPELRQQVALDLEGGFIVQVCKLSTVESQIGATDFGIWDDEYVCIVTENDGPNPDVLLTSRQEDMPQAHSWMDTILKQSIKVTSLQELDRWSQVQRWS